MMFNPCISLLRPVASSVWEQEGWKHSGLGGQKEDSDFKVGRINLEMNDKLT